MFKVIGTLTKLAVVLAAGFLYLSWMSSDMEADPNQNNQKTSVETVPTRSGRIKQDCMVYPSPSEDAKPIGWLSRRTAVVVQDGEGEWLELLAPGATRYLDKSAYLPWSELKKHDKLYIKKATFTTKIMTGRGGARPSNPQTTPRSDPNSQQENQNRPAIKGKGAKKQPSPPAH